MLKGRDVTDELKAAGVHWATFGNSQDNDHDDWSRLAPAVQKEFAAEGLYKDGGSTWELQRRYHWQQRFPAHGTVRIRHEYKPVLGMQIVDTATLKPALPANRAEEGKYTHEIFDSLCVSKPAQAKLTQPAHELGPRWVDFILTTANTWKQPIGDFTLLVDRKFPTDVVSFCWDGPVEKVGANQFRAHAQNLVPAKELRVGWYDTGLPHK